MCGMRTHVDALPRLHQHRAELVEEDEGADHLPARRGQRAAHLEAAEVTRARHDDHLDGIRRGGIAGHRIGDMGQAHDVASFTLGATLVPSSSMARMQLLVRHGADRHLDQDTVDS